MPVGGGAGIPGMFDLDDRGHLSENRLYFLFPCQGMGVSVGDILMLVQGCDS